MGMCCSSCPLTCKAPLFSSILNMFRLLTRGLRPLFRLQSRRFEPLRNGVQVSSSGRKASLAPAKVRCPQRSS